MYVVYNNVLVIYYTTRTTCVRRTLRGIGIKKKKTNATGNTFCSYKWKRLIYRDNVNFYTCRTIDRITKQKSFRRAYFRVIVKRNPIERTISGFTSNERSYSCFIDQVAIVNFIHLWTEIRIG